MLDHNFIDAGEILKKLEKTAKRKGKPVYTPRLHQERECLHGIDLYWKSREDLAPNDIRDIRVKHSRTRHGTQ